MQRERTNGMCVYAYFRLCEPMKKYEIDDMLFGFDAKTREQMQKLFLLCQYFSLLRSINAREGDITCNLQ